MKVLIVESPSKCKKILSILNKLYPNEDYNVIASCGHFRDIDKIDEDYKIHFKVSPSKYKNVSNIDSKIKNNDVIIATDDDREGEAIGWHICDYFNLDIQTTPRILFHEITSDAIQKAIEEPKNINMNIVKAQMARMICDRWIGYKISPFLWRNVGNKLSAGRCQTPTLNLVYEREQEIKNNIPKIVFKTQTFFNEPVNDYVNLKKEFLNEESVRDFIENSKTFEHKITSFTNKEGTRKPPIPFCTSTLQQFCSNNFNWSPDKTMKIAQSLYEKGKITYHRTESTSIAQEFRKKIVEYIEKGWGKEYVITTKKKLKKENDKQLAHECIRPTNIIIEDNELENDEKKLLKNIWKYAIQSCMSDCILKIYSLKINSPINKVFYEKNIEKISFLGFKILDSEKKSKEQLEIQIEKNIIVDFKSIKSEQSLKDTKLHYNEGQIIKLLDEKQIGRPSTFSSFVDKIKDRKYVEKTNYKGKNYDLLCIQYLRKENQYIEKKNAKISEEKSKIILSELGDSVCKFLYDNFDHFFNYDYTARMESDLDKIADGTLNDFKFLDDLNKEIQSKLKVEPKIERVKETSILRSFLNFSIRRGKNNQSDYIFYKNDTMTKPKFISLKNFKSDYLDCSEEIINEYLQKHI